MHRVDAVTRRIPEVRWGDPCPAVLEHLRTGGRGSPWTAITDRSLVSSMVYQAKYLSDLTGEPYETCATRILHLHRQYADSRHILFPDALLVFVPHGERLVSRREDPEVDVHEGQLAGDEERLRYLISARIFERETNFPSCIIEQGPGKNSLGLLVVSVVSVLDSIARSRRIESGTELEVTRTIRTALVKCGCPLTEREADVQLGDLHVTFDGRRLRVDVEKG